MILFINGFLVGSIIGICVGLIAKLDLHLEFKEDKNGMIQK